MNVKGLVNNIIKEWSYSVDELLATSTFDDLGFDSLDRVEVLMALEDEFGEEVPDEVAENWNTLQDVYDYFENAVLP